jgi:hypothetical protein
VFLTVVWWGTERASVPVEQLLLEEIYKTAADRARETARHLLVFRLACDRRETRLAVEGLAPFALAIDRCSSHRQVLDETLQRHHRVQSGKLDGGVAKRDWVAFDDGDKLLRPSPQFQCSEPPPQPTGTYLTHPYRLEQFVGMLSESGMLPLP